MKLIGISNPNLEGNPTQYIDIKILNYSRNINNSDIDINNIKIPNLSFQNLTTLKVTNTRMRPLVRTQSF